MTRTELDILRAIAPTLDAGRPLNQRKICELIGKDFYYLHRYLKWFIEERVLERPRKGFYVWRNRPAALDDIPPFEAVPRPHIVPHAYPDVAHKLMRGRA